MAEGVKLSGRAVEIFSLFVSYVAVGDNSLDLSAIKAPGLSMPNALPSFSVVGLGTDIVIHGPNSVIGIPVPQVELERRVNGHPMRSQSHPPPEYSNGGYGNRFYCNGSARRRF